MPWAASGSFLSQAERPQVGRTKGCSATSRTGSRRSDRSCRSGFKADVPRLCPTSTLRTAAKPRQGSRALRRRSYGGSMPHTARSSTRSRRCRLTRTSISWPFDSSAARRTATSRSICRSSSPRFRTSGSRTRKSSTSSRGAPTSTGKITSPSLGSTFETADPRGHGEGWPRRPRPRREGRGARAARRRHGGDLHRRASDAGTGRRDRAAGGCRCHRRIAPVRSPQLHLSADRRAHEGKRNGRRPAVRRWDHPGGRRGRSGQSRGGARLSTGRIARRDHDIRQGSGSTKAWRALITKAKGRSKMAKKDDRPIDAGLAALHGKSEQEAIDFWKSRFGMIAAIPSDTARVGALTPQLRELVRITDLEERKRLTTARIKAFVQIPADQRDRITKTRQAAFNVDRGVLEEDQKMVDELTPNIPEARGYPGQPTAAR